jgi:DNA-binding transcriptional MerR regulator
MSTQFSTATVAELTGASIRKVDYWARTGLLTPSGREAAGKGSQRKYTFQDLVALLAICKLRECSCPLQKIRAAVRHLRSHYPDLPTSASLSRLTLLTDGKSVYMLTDGQQVMDIVSRQLCWSVPLGRLIIETNERIETLPQQWSEEFSFGRKTFHLIGTRPRNQSEVIVRCRELPGAIGRAETSETAFSLAKQAVESFVSCFGVKGRSERSLAQVEIR